MHLNLVKVEASFEEVVKKEGDCHLEAIATAVQVYNNGRAVVEGPRATHLKLYLLELASRPYVHATPNAIDAECRLTKLYSSAILPAADPLDFFNPC